MTVSVVYRGWTYDLVPTPGYNSHVSATSRQGSVPFIKPDLQPDNKVYNNRDIDSSSHTEQKLNIIGPDHQQYTQPNVTNFSQEVLAAVKLKLGRSHWDNDRFTRRLGSDISGINWEDTSGESKSLRHRPCPRMPGSPWIPFPLAATSISIITRG